MAILSISACQVSRICILLEGIRNFYFGDVFSTDDRLEIESEKFTLKYFPDSLTVL